MPLKENINSFTVELPFQIYQANSLKTLKFAILKCESVL